ncbi:MAG: selenide, water dikinase SelD [Thermoleophilia bacterium]|nr:selenide, water dikinase SelD [Thermoleophilia bacterium]
MSGLLSRGAGCGCKLAPGELAAALAALPGRPPDAGVLVGPEHMDDAAVVRIADDRAVVATVDFFTPPVDDPGLFGRIAAVNALSDVFAMGGTPLLALAVTAYPRDGDPAVLGQILAGGAAAAAELGCPVLGGHSIDDPEPKYGLAVTGLAHPDRLMTNDAGRAGDRLVLTKPLGTGIALTAARDGRPEARDAAVASMLVPNRDAAAAALEAGVRCATDVTGFGLLGHLREVAAASGLAARVDADAVPALDGVLGLAGHSPGGARRTLAFLEPWVRWDAGVAPERRALLVDPQTSGGLLIAVGEDRLAALEGALGVRGVPWWPVGALQEGPPGEIMVA